MIIKSSNYLEMLNEGKSLFNILDDMVKKGKEIPEFISEDLIKYRNLTGDGSFELNENLMNSLPFRTKIFFRDYFITCNDEEIFNPKKMNNNLEYYLLDISPFEFAYKVNFEPEKDKLIITLRTGLKDKYIYAYEDHIIKKKLKHIQGNCGFEIAIYNFETPKLKLLYDLEKVKELKKIDEKEGFIKRGFYKYENIDVPLHLYQILFDDFEYFPKEELLRNKNLDTSQNILFFPKKEFIRPGNLSLSQDIILETSLNNFLNSKQHQKYHIKSDIVSSSSTFTSFINEIYFPFKNMDFTIHIRDENRIEARVMSSYSNVFFRDYITIPDNVKSLIK